MSMFTPSFNGMITLYWNDEKQQDDSHSCGYWALENYYRTCHHLSAEKPLSELATHTKLLCDGKQPTSSSEGSSTLSSEAVLQQYISSLSHIKKRLGNDR